MSPARLRRALERALLLGLPVLAPSCFLGESSCPDNGHEPPESRVLPGAAPAGELPLDADTCRELCAPVEGGGVITCVREGAGDLRCIVRPLPCEGRRPAGLCDVRPSAPSGIGCHLATAAWLEAASVDAFRELRRELRAVRAPRRLLRAASRSARDERRHARQSLALARRFGAQPAPVTRRPAPPRSLLELALDNAIEGCVRETWGALIARYQSEQATEPSVRATMRRIARDELKHAELAWELERFFASRLTPQERDLVARAQARAIQQLAAETSCELPSGERLRLGLPTAARAAAMLAELAIQLR